MVRLQINNEVVGASGDRIILRTDNLVMRDPFAIITHLVNASCLLEFLVELLDVDSNSLTILSVVFLRPLLSPG